MDILSVQIALFPKELITRPDSLYLPINNQMGGIFDAIPIILPVPENAPPEIPIVQMSSGDGKYKANIARNRVDFFCLAQSSDGAFEGVTIRKVTISLKQFSDTILKLTSISRVGCVFTAFKEDTNAVQTIARKYFIGEEFKKSSELSFYRNNPSETRGVRINKILKVSSGRWKKGLIDTDGIIIEQDINTLQSESAIIEKATIQSLIEHMSSNMGDKELEKLL